METNNLENTKQEVEKDESESYQFLGTAIECFVFISVLNLLSAGPLLFSNGFPSHADWHSHMEHAYNFKVGFFEGQILPRWADAPTSGYGLPTFNFYGPLFYYIFTFIDLIVNNPVLANKLSYVSTMVLCSITGFIYLRNHGSRAAAATATAFIVFSPAIHIFIYNCNWPVSTLAMAFVFSALYGIDSFKKEKDLDIKNILIVAASFAFMILSHIITAFVFTLLAIPYFCFNLWIHKSKTFVKNFILSFGLGGILTSFYFFPAALERNYVQTTEVLTSGIWDYTKNFLFTYLDRPPNGGYAWGIFDHRYYEVSNALFLIATTVCFVILLSQLDNVKKYIKEPFRVIAVAVMFLISAVMMTPASIFVWLIFKQLQILQFPWRFTTFIVPFGALLMVYVFDLVKKMRSDKLSTGGIRAMYGIIFVSFSLLAYVNYINMFRWDWAPNQSLMKVAKYVLFINAEYRPRIQDNIKTRNINYNNDFSPAVYVANPQSNIDLIDWRSHKRVFQVFSPTQSTVSLRLFYFPGWEVLIDGKKVPIRLNSRGGIIFNTPPGNHEVVVQFVNTPVRKYSKYVSLVALMVYMLLLMKLVNKPKKIVEVAS